MLVSEQERSRPVGPMFPAPGHPDEYELDDIAPEARPTESHPHALHLLPLLDKREPFKPRRSRAIPWNGQQVTFYWCRVCNRCLPHWRSAFCEVHRRAYKKMRRRRRTRAEAAERQQEYVRVPREVLEDLYQTVHQHLEAHESARNTNDPEHRQRAARLRREAFDQVLTRLPQYL